MKIPTILALQLFIASGCLALPVERVETDPELTAGHFEGDMIIDVTKRNGLLNETFRWPNRTLYYYMNENIDEEHRNYILEAINMIQNNSCIIFKEARKNQSYYVNITTEEKGCFSTVAFKNHVQKMNLETNELGKGCFRLGTIEHEFLHALGFHHQQSAANRDDYVRIHKENIKSNHIRNFKKFDADSVTDFGQGYDYASVMHYKPCAFSFNYKMTIEPLQEGAEEFMGQRTKMTDTDIKKLNLMYECPGFV